jgi:hypothetical protein
LISFLTRTRPSPEHFLQYSEMTSPSPTHVGQIETYKIRKRKALMQQRKIVINNQIELSVNIQVQARYCN